MRKSNSRRRLRQPEYASDEQMVLRFDRQLQEQSEIDQRPGRSRSKKPKVARPEGLITLSGRQLAYLGMPNACPACFWIERRYAEEERVTPFGIPMPGIFSSIDAFSKNYVHDYIDREHTLPPGLPDLGFFVDGYVDSKDLYWKNFSYIDSDSNIELRGSPDDVIIAEGRREIFDYKTAKFTPTQDKLSPMYHGQLNAYAFIAKRIWPDVAETLGSLWLVYFEPDNKAIDPEIGPRLKFEANSIKVPLWSEDRIKIMLLKARHIYDEPTCPDHVDGCENESRINTLMRLCA